MALEHAEHPEQSAATLKQERLACGIDETDLDTAVPGAREVGKACRIPGAAHIMARIGDDMRLMAAPVLAAKEPGFSDRLKALLGAMPDTKDDFVDPAAISAMMQAGHSARDSLHRLVMAQAASMGVACGALALDTVAVDRLVAAGTPAFLVWQDTVTSYIERMARAAAS